LEKLDMILVTRSWEMLFPTALVHKIPREYSDHNPLIMVSGNRFFFLHKSREFRFELACLDHEEFLPKVKEILMAPTRDTRSLDKVMFKLKKVKKFLKGWGYNLAGNRKKRKKEIENLILELEE
jgi:hypothetical protein